MTNNGFINISNEDTHNQVPDLLKDVDIENSVKKSSAMLTRTKSNNSNEMQCNTENAINIRVVCDIFIIGMEPIEWVSKEDLLRHKNCLSAENYELFFKRKIPNLIVDQ